MNLVLLVRGSSFSGTREIVRNSDYMKHKTAVPYAFVDINSMTAGIPSAKLNALDPEAYLR